MSTVSIANNTISLSGEYYSLLEDPELVSGAVIVSDGNCSLREMAIPMNISTRKGIGREFSLLYLHNHNYYRVLSLMLECMCYA